MKALHSLQAQGHLVVRSGEIGPAKVKALKKAGYLQPIMKGWYHLSDPSSPSGDTTPWTMSYWSFVQRYCEHRFGSDWVLSPEICLGLHVGSQVPPTQLIVHSPKGGNNRVDLPGEQSIFDLKVKQLPEQERRVQLPNGLRVYTPEATLIHMAESCYHTQAMSAAALIGSYRNVDALLRAVLGGAHRRPGNRLVGAFKHLKMDDHAKRLADGMRRADMDLRHENPFTGEGITVVAGAAPIANMLRAIWQRDRQTIIDLLPAPTVPIEVDEVLKKIDDAYTHDAWNSLSIEGYRVSEELIDKIRGGSWDPEADRSDATSRDVMAAKGYWNVFQSAREVVKTSIERGEPVSVRDNLSDWYQDLFEPSIDAGILTRGQVIGYRNHPVFVRTANHVPPACEKLMDAMETYFDLLDEEEHFGVRAVLGHWLLGYIHPYPDGNGRLARFVMNAVLASSGYTWTVIRLDQRTRYMQALDAASFGCDIIHFTKLISEHLGNKP